MALATVDDVEAALGRSLTSTEDVDTLLEEASDLVVAWLRVTPDPVPAAVARAVATMVVACVDKPEVTATDYNAGGYNTSQSQTAIRVGVESATTTGPWLTASLKERLRPYRISVRSLGLVSELADG